MTPAVLTARLGPPQRDGSLILYPLFSDPAVATPQSPQNDGGRTFRTRPYLTLAESQAVPTGSVRFTEKGSGQVPVLELHNLGDDPVLVLAGEIVEGNLQNRSVNVSLIAPAHSHLEIPVSCVEQGRWRAARARTDGETFAPPPDPPLAPRMHVPPQVRRAQAAGVAKSVRRGTGKRSAQAAVWDAVSAELAAARVVSATQDLTESYSAVCAGDDAETAPSASQLRPVRDQVGVVAAVGDQVLALDLFDSPATLMGYWDGLVAGYAFDAAHREAGPAGPNGVDPQADGRVWRRPSDERAIQAAVESFLQHVLAAEQIRTPGVGVGFELHLDTAVVVGSGLIWQDRLIHLAAHPAAA